MKARIFPGIVLTLIVSALSGCGAQVVDPSGPRKPTDPAMVQIYQKEPSKYEFLGTVEVPVGGDVTWDEKGDATVGFDRLKAAAAAKGANGLLLQYATNSPVVVAGYKGTFYRVPVRVGKQKYVVAEAIYVLK